MTCPTRPTSVMISLTVVKRLFICSLHFSQMAGRQFRHHVPHCLLLISQRSCNRLHLQSKSTKQWPRRAIMATSHLLHRTLLKGLMDITHTMLTYELNALPLSKIKLSSYQTPVRTAHSIFKLKNFYTACDACLWMRLGNWRTKRKPLKYIENMKTLHTLRASRNRTPDPKAESQLC